MARRPKNSLTIEGFGTVCIRDLSEAELRELLTRQNPRTPDAARFIITRALVDAAGRPLLDPNDPNDLDNIGAGTLIKIAAAALLAINAQMKALATKRQPRFSFPWQQQRTH